MTADETFEYWQLVRACLIEIYSLSPEQASLAVTSLRRRLADRSSSDGSADLIYHSAPIHVASDLADPYREISEAMWKRWQELLERSQLESKAHSAQEAKLAQRTPPNEVLA